PIEFLKVAHTTLLEDGVEGSPVGIREAILRLRRRGMKNVVVSRAPEPIGALLGDAWGEVDPPKVQAVEPRGAGDSMTGALAYCVGIGLDPTQALRFAAAAGATSVTRHGHATGLR